MANIFEVPQPGNDLLEKAEKVRLASIKISQTENQNRIKALNFMADYLEKNSKEIFKILISTTMGSTVLLSLKDTTSNLNLIF